MTTKQQKPTMARLLLLLAFPLLFTACSSDETSSAKSDKASTQSKAKAPEKKHEDPGEASDTAKYRFEKEFAKNCVTRELKNSNNVDNDRLRIEENCGCIARHISEDLDDVDAEKYLQEHEDTHTLQIKFDAGAFFCMQNKPQPKGPHLFGRQ